MINCKDKPKINWSFTHLRYRPGAWKRIWWNPHNGGESLPLSPLDFNSKGLREGPAPSIFPDGRARIFSTTHKWMDVKGVCYIYGLLQEWLFPYIVFSTIRIVISCYCPQLNTQNIPLFSLLPSRYGQAIVPLLLLCDVPKRLFCQFHIQRNDWSPSLSDVCLPQSTQRHCSLDYCGPTQRI